jgi:hypothetical protein
MRASIQRDLIEHRITDPSLVSEKIHDQTGGVHRFNLTPHGAIDLTRT